MKYYQVVLPAYVAAALIGVSAFACFEDSPEALTVRRAEGPGDIAFIQHVRSDEAADVSLPLERRGKGKRGKGKRNGRGKRRHGKGKNHGHGQNKNNHGHGKNNLAHGKNNHAHGHNSHRKGEKKHGTRHGKRMMIVPDQPSSPVRRNVEAEFEGPFARRDDSSSAPPLKVPQSDYRWLPRDYFDTAELLGRFPADFGAALGQRDVLGGLETLD